MKKILLVAGEASADLYGSYLVKELQVLDKGLCFFGLGGPRMRSSGVELFYDLTSEAAAGLDPLVKFGRFARIFRQLTSHIKKDKPDIAVLIDFPDFNLRLARVLKQYRIPVIYYISPQVWAWRKGRIKTIARLVTKMLVIFEFETTLYQKYGVPVEFVGHPLMDVISKIRNPKSEIRNQLGLREDGLIIGLLPGSRVGEFRRHFPILIKAIDLIKKELPGVQFILAAAPKITSDLIEKYLPAQPPPLHIVSGKTYEVMQASDLLITASGTATVEAAIFGTPMIVIYKVSPLTAWAFGPLIKTPYYAMVNIIAGKKVVPELIQKAATPQKIAAESLTLLREERLKEIQTELEMVRSKLGSAGASRRTAEIIFAQQT